MNYDHKSEVKSNNCHPKSYVIDKYLHHIRDLLPLTPNMLKIIEVLEDSDKMRIIQEYNLVLQILLENLDIIHK